MFMASVIVGKAIELPQDSSLREPPTQPNTYIPFDSVQGETLGCPVTIVYSNKKAYPSYLITY